jgi:hypothetical protein
LGYEVEEYDDELTEEGQGEAVLEGKMSEQSVAYAWLS